MVSLFVRLRQGMQNAIVFFFCTVEENKDLVHQQGLIILPHMLCNRVVMSAKSRQHRVRGARPIIDRGAVLQHGRRRRQALQCCCALLLVVACAALHAHSKLSISGQAKAASYLEFDVCNGFSNQKLSIVYAAALARRHGRHLVLPSLVRDGTQKYAGATAADVTATGNNSLPFEAMFDVRVFTDALHKHGLRVVRRRPDSMRVQSVQARAFDTRPSDYKAEAAIHVGCPLFKVSKQTMQQTLTVAVLQALVPSRPKQAVIQRIVTTLRQHSPTGEFNAVHLRFEQDWVDHCHRWSSIADGVTRDNCGLVHPAEAFRLFDHATPLYVAADWDKLSPPYRAAADQALHPYRAHFRDDVHASRSSAPARWSREEAALIDYHVSLHAHTWSGNSVSTFSALLILERQFSGKQAAWYNGGDIPLAFELPVYRTPWVFTYNNFSTPEYETLLKVAVWTAIRRGHVMPHCLFAGDRTPLLQWMETLGVVVHYVDTDWIDRLWLSTDSAKHKLASHLYARRDLMVSTMQRLDIPLFDELHHEHVLYTDADVLFRRHFDMRNDVAKLPRCLAMGTENRGTQPPYNAGVMLINMTYARLTYTSFKAFIESAGPPQGMHFGEDGPLDQGAYNAFYRPDIDVLPDTWNDKPYHPHNAEAMLVHFHGPKPWDYASYASTKQCALVFGDLCELGVQHGATEYMSEWYAALAEADADFNRTLWKLGTGRFGHRKRAGARKFSKTVRLRVDRG
jgi:GDP-fucose protein O-fucosyltransferase